MFKKILSGILLSVWVLGSVAQANPILERRLGFSLTKLDRLKAIGGLTFSKDYSSLPTGIVTEAQLNADLAVGSPVADFTSARSASAPATYVDDQGKIQLVTTADVGRIQGGYYDATGFHTKKGLMVEAAGRICL